MAVYQKFNAFVQNLANGIINLGGDRLNVMLTNTAPTPSDAVAADISEIPAGSGYRAGGLVLMIGSSLQSGGTYILIPALSAGSVTFVNTGTGIIGPFRYPVLYDASAPNSPLIAWYDYGSTLALNPGDSFVVLFPLVSGVLQIT